MSTIWRIYCFTKMTWAKKNAACWYLRECSQCFNLTMFETMKTLIRHWHYTLHDKNGYISLFRRLVIPRARYSEGSIRFVIPSHNPNPKPNLTLNLTLTLILILNLNPNPNLGFRNNETYAIFGITNLRNIEPSDCPR